MGLVGASQFFGPTVFNMATEALHLAAGGPCITLAAAVQLGFAFVASLVLVRARRGKGGEGLGRAALGCGRWVLPQPKASAR